VNLDWIDLVGFRSYQQLRYEPAAGVNVLVGPNGAGKTNLLEAIGYLGMLKSFRAAPDGALVSTSGDVAVIRGQVSSGDRRSLIEIEVPANGRRRIQVNRQRLARTADMLGHLRIVVFLPDDLDIIKRGPGLRRGFLDDLAVQLWPASYLDQQEYDKILRQRNGLLRFHGRDADPTTLAVWNERLSQAGAKVMERRARACASMREGADDAYRRLSSTDDAVRFGYESSWGGSLDPDEPLEGRRARLWAALEDADKDDRERRVTTRGPHRDEPVVLLGDRPSRTHASQGEQRSLILSMRLASHDAIAEVVGEPPVLVLDDVFSELDIERARALASALPTAQTFISTARFEEVPVEGTRFEVGRGGVA